MEISSNLIKVKKVISTQRHPKYGYVMLSYEAEFLGDEPFVMSSAFSIPDFYYLGDEKMAKFICKKMKLEPHLISDDLEEQAKYLVNMSWDEKAKMMLSGYDNIFLGTPASIGWSKEEQKWYGWSHRAIYGFGIGDSVTRDSCAYIPTDKEDFALWAISFYCDGGKYPYTVKKIEYDVETGQGGPGIYLEYTYIRDDGTPYINCGTYPYPEKWGNGEWTPKTLDDAKQMAIDFSDGVS